MVARDLKKTEQFKKIEIVGLVNLTGENSNHIIEVIKSLKAYDWDENLF